jgi:hypothetical protein
MSLLTSLNSFRSSHGSSSTTHWNNEFLQVFVKFMDALTASVDCGVGGRHGSLPWTFVFGMESAVVLMLLNWDLE